MPSAKADVAQLSTPSMVVMARCMFPPNHVLKKRSAIRPFLTRKFRTTENLFSARAQQTHRSGQAHASDAGLAGAQRRAEQTLAARSSRALAGDSRARNAV